MQTREELTGTFPFGRPSKRCQPRRAADADVFVLGVYPSALHVRWVHPEFQVAALAVDEEPWPFWDGVDQHECVDRWKLHVGWQSTWGRAAPAGRLNGSSGVAVRDHVLGPLEVDVHRAWLTDAVPFFHVHRGPRTQGSAMSERYDPFAREQGLPVHDLPDRPSAERLIRYAVEHELDRLREELLESRAPLLVTLGNEALAVAAALCEGDLPQVLRPDSAYGTRCAARVGRQAMEVLPLVHPGQRAAAWRTAHNRWRDSRYR